MPRQSRSRPAPRPAASAPSNSRGAHTATAPAGNAPPAPTPVASAPASAQAPTQSREPGMLAQMAATAGSVAIGSTIGHGISSMLFGGSRQAEPVPEAAPVQQQNAQGMSCDVQAKEFSKCLEKADLQSCSYYLEQLKACQAAAAPY